MAKRETKTTICGLVLAGDAEGLLKQLKKGGDANEEHFFQRTAWWPEAEGSAGTIRVEHAPALVLAAKAGRADLVKLLLAHGARIDASAYYMDHVYLTDDDLYPCDSVNSLEIAARMGHLEVVRLLLKAGAHEGSPGEGSEPLRQAVSGGQLEMVKFFIERGVDVTAPYQGKMPPITLAAEKGHLKVMKLLLQKVARTGPLKSEENQIDQRVYAMGLAARKGHAKVVAILLAEGVLVDSCDNGGETALMRCAMAGHGEVVKLLLKQGASIGFQNDQGKTALDLAREMGHGYLGEKDHQEIVQMLEAQEV